jgi:hypothetical protein
VVEAYGNELGPPLTPHDVRHTRKGRLPLEQIQIALGHASIQTTERYLGVEQDLMDAPPCDHLRIRDRSADLKLGIVHRSDSLQNWSCSAYNQLGERLTTSV